MSTNVKVGDVILDDSGPTVKKMYKVKHIQYFRALNRDMASISADHEYPVLTALIDTEDWAVSKFQAYESRAGELNFKSGHEIETEYSMLCLMLTDQESS